MKKINSLFILLVMACLNAFAQQGTLDLGEYESATADNSSATKYDGNNWYNAPIIPAYQHSGVQFIYTADELKAMTDSLVTSMKFKFYSEGFYDDYSSHLKLYLSETDDAVFTKNDAGSYQWMSYDTAAPAADFTFSFSGYDYDYSDCELTFDLSSAPYKYTGKNLVVTVYNDAESTIDGSNGNIAFYNYDVTGVRILTFASDKTDFATSQAADNIVSGSEERSDLGSLPAVLFTYKSEPKPEEPVIEEKNTVTVGGYNEASVDNSEATKYDATNIYNAPLIPTYKHSATQFIYTSDELKEMTDSLITSLKFKYYAETTEDYASEVTLYLNETDNAEFQKEPLSEKYQWMDFDAAMPAAAQDFTFSGIELYSSDGELTFDLSEKPYKYTGKNLIVTVVNDADAYLDPSLGFISFYNYDVTGVRMLSFASDKRDFTACQETDNIVKDADEYHLDRGLPVAKFTYKKDDTPATAISGAPSAANDDIVAVKGGDGCVTVALNQTAKVLVFSVSGQVAANAVYAEGTHTISLKAGVYVVKSGRTACKVVVR